MMIKQVKNIFANGILFENPVLRLIIGVCPTLAVTTLAFNGLGMGLAATFVLVCSNIVISALRNIIPDKVRIPAFITVIAAFVTVVMMVVKAYLPALDAALGIFLPLIVVNCIILGRAEMYASKNPVFFSAIDGIAMGIGFTITLILMGGIRELLGAGTLFSISITKDFIQPMGVFITPAGGFFVYGILIAAALQLEKLPFSGSVSNKSPCAGCPTQGCQAETLNEKEKSLAVSENVKKATLSTEMAITSIEQANNKEYSESEKIQEEKGGEQ